MLFDHYVAVRPWEVDFVSSKVTINKTMVWIRFPSPGMEYYDESVLTALATAVGKPIKVDIRTIDASREKFARVCVEIDLDKPVVGKIWFRNRWFHVEYEGLHLLCSKCGLFGHPGRNCLHVKTVAEPVQNAPTNVNVEKRAAKDGSRQGGDIEGNPKPNNSNLSSDCNGWGELHGDWIAIKIINKFAKERNKSAIKDRVNGGGNRNRQQFKGNHFSIKQRKRGRYSNRGPTRH